VLPTDDIPKSLLESSSSSSGMDGRSWYKAWSQLTYDHADEGYNSNNTDNSSNSNVSISDKKLLLCYKDDGRVAVNPEFAACTGVFAAGSVAKCGNSLTGHANVAGVGAVDGPASGRVAAINMARNYYDNKHSREGGGLFGSRQTTTTSAYRIVSKDPVPVWRSDLLSYDANAKTMSSLASVGIYALCVGHCDSERFSTHGVWWTNLAAQKRLAARQQQDEQYAMEEKNGIDQGQDRSPKQQRRRLRKKSSSPVYGLGIVFYLDRTGKIHGVMTWGIPFSNNDLQLNNDLVQQMKQIIVRSHISGGFAYAPSAPFTLGSESQMLVSHQLTFASRQLLATAFSSLDDDVQDFPRPLHRFTEVRPPRVRSVGVLKRNDDGHGQGVLGEDMFYGQSSSIEQTDPSPVPMKPIAGVGFASPQSGTVEESPPADNGNGKASSSTYMQRRASVRTRNVSYQSAQNMHNFFLHEHREKQFEDNEALARPPKEEPLWIRKGDEKRQTNAAESRSAALRAAFGA
jgi:Apoptosis-inducing factor, mitochondrion-associated, C-term